MQRISGHEFPIKKIFSDDFEFVIPHYQRPYSWTVEEAEELFDDLYNFMQQTRNGNNPEPYFLGSIVLIKEDNNPRSEVIDGQQRLTTLTILLACLAEKLSGNNRTALLKYINQPGNPIENLDPKPRLTLRERNKEFFRTYIQTEGKLKELFNKNPNGLTDPQKNIRNNAELFWKKIEQLDVNEVFQFASFIVLHCYLVVVSTPNMESAYRIFSVLNDRGLELLPSDILKAEIIGKIDETRQEEYTKKWEEAEDNLGREAFNDLLAHIRTIYKPVKQQKTLLEEFREHVLSVENNPSQFIDTVLCPYANSYDIILNTSYQSTSNADALNDTLHWLLRIDHRDWVPPALLFLKNNQSDTNLLTQFFVALERLTASMFFRRQNVNERNERYGRLIEAIKNNTLWGKDSPLMLTDEEKERTLKVLNEDIYLLNPKVRNYILLRLDSWLSSADAIYQHKVITVEHVLPQTIKKGSKWHQDWPDENIRNQWVHKLGNLVLLSRRKNSSAQNYDFTEKKAKYFQTKNGVSTFALTTEVLNTDKWTPDVVQQRHEKLIQELKKRWNL